MSTLAKNQFILTQNPKINFEQLLNIVNGKSKVKLDNFLKQHFYDNISAFQNTNFKILEENNFKVNFSSEFVRSIFIISQLRNLKRILKNGSSNVENGENSIKTNKNMQKSENLNKNVSNANNVQKESENDTETLNLEFPSLKNIQLEDLLDETYFKKIDTLLQTKSAEFCRCSKISGLVVLLPFARFLINFADIAAALSCEVLMQNVKIFNSAAIYNYETTPLINTTESAKIILNLLENSRLCNKNSKIDHHCFHSVPFTHSVARQSLKRVEAQLISLLNAPFEESESLTKSQFDSVLTETKILAESIRVLGEGSSERISLFLKDPSLNKYFDSNSKWCNFEIEHQNQNRNQIEKLEKLQNLNKIQKLNKCVISAMKNFVFEVFIAFSKIDFLQCEKIKEVEQKQRQKENKANKNKNSNSEKEILKRRQILAKKSKLGLGLKTEHFFNNFRDIFLNFNSNFESISPKIWQKSEEISKLISSSDRKMRLANAKGTRDSTPLMMVVREIAFDKIKSVFYRYGAVSIDTPVFEKQELLKGKYGEDSKLIFDLKDQGGELLSLRYDLTVPFARYVSMNKIKEIKRFQIGKVYRRDQPAVNKGKFREFYQCDFDIAGEFSPMMADSEIVAICVDILTELNLGEFVVKLNHRKLLDAIMAYSGVPSVKFRTICSAIDKLDKLSWEEVRAEMIQKGINFDTAEKIKQFIDQKNTPNELIKILRKNLSQNKTALAALAEMEILFKFLQSHGCLDKVVFDLSLARGLDYYTGLILEAVLKSENNSSIAGGGRYDDLIGMFSGRKIPAIGMSIGIERILAILNSQNNSKNTKIDQNNSKNGQNSQNSILNYSQIKSKKTFVLIGSSTKEKTACEMIEFCKTLRAQNVPSEIILDCRLDAQRQINKALSDKCNFMVFIGENFRLKNQVQIKNLVKQTKQDFFVEEAVKFLVLAYREFSAV